LRVVELPIDMILRELSGVEAKRKNLGKFVDSKRANGDGETLEQPVGKFSFLLLDPE
jgi:hypothetical protein